MKRISGPRRTANLCESVHQRLNMYAVAAGATGVGVLALTQPSEAKIVYTPVHVRIHGSYCLDFDFEGRTDDCDFSFSQVDGNTSNGGVVSHIGAGPYRGNRTNVDAVVASGSLAVALRAGARIGPREPFNRSAFLAKVFVPVTGRSSWQGQWANGGKGLKNGYLGLKFKLNGTLHYGWARVTVTVSDQRFKAILTGYAYETIAGKSIIAGRTKGQEDVVGGTDAALRPPTRKPATLGLLAVGSPALSVWRREAAVGAAR